MSRILLVVTAGLFAGAGVEATPDSAMFRGGPEHLGVYESSTQPTLSSVAWKFKTSGKVISSPTVDANTVYFGSTDHKLYAVNRADGTLKWAFDTYGAVNSSPAIGNGLVMFGSVDGRFYAVDATSGKQKWIFKTAGESRFTARGIHGAMPRSEMMADPFDVFLSSPVISGGVIYFGSGDHYVYALDVATGAHSNGSSPPATLSTHLRLSPTTSYTSGAGTEICMRSMRRQARCSGSTRPAKTR
jgi:FOG: WD40-like repeat